MSGAASQPAAGQRRSVPGHMGRAFLAPGNPAPTLRVVRRRPRQPERHDRGASSHAPRYDNQPRRAGHFGDAGRHSDSIEMEGAITRPVERQFPELTLGYHLPRFAKVIDVPDAPAGAGVCDDFRPRFGVDLQVLGLDGEIDATLPVLSGGPLAVPWASMPSLRSAPRSWCALRTAYRTSPIFRWCWLTA